MTETKISEAAKKLNEAAFQSATNRKVVNLVEAIEILNTSTELLRKAIATQDIALANYARQVETQMYELRNLRKENEELKAEVEAFKNNNRYHRGYSAGELSGKAECDSLRALAQHLVNALKCADTFAQHSHLGGERDCLICQSVKPALSHAEQLGIKPSERDGLPQPQA